MYFLCLLPSLSMELCPSFLFRIVCCVCTERLPISLVSVKFLPRYQTEFPVFCSVLF